MVSTEAHCYASPASSEPVSLAQAFAAVREFTETWSAMLSPEDQMVQSCPQASPVKWHMAHTTWFFETFLLREFAPDYVPPEPEFLWLFNSYYKSLGEHPEKSLRSSFSRPSLDAIRAYRESVNAAMQDLIASLDARPEVEAEEIRDRIEIGLHHEQQHQELIATDIKHALWTNPLHPALRPLPQFPPALRDEQPLWRSMDGGMVTIGHDGRGFAFDNESPRHRYFLEPYRIANHLVTVREFLAFIDDGGYAQAQLWLSEGWDAVTANGWRAPLYWMMHEGAWHIFTLHGLLPLSGLLDTPVCHVSYFEADAYARWAGARLPSEFEWEHAAGKAPVKDAGVLTAAGLRFGCLHPTGHPSIYGGAWQWTQSAYTPYPGFKPLEGALGEYNGKFMSGQMVLRGGSVVTPSGHMRATYRNFFHAPTRWQFSGIRLAKDGTA